jgi:DNA polymerase
MDLNRQLRLHIEALRSAGVEWVELPPMPRRESACVGDSSPEAQPMPAQTLPNKPAPASATVSTQDKLASLTLLNDTEVRGCTKCAELARTRKQTVFGVGNVDAELCFVGEAPGADEDQKGEPFVGAAGQLLNKIIIACTLTREEVYICNVLKCRPPGNRTPLPDEVANCSSYLERQLATVRPKYICVLGACAAQSLLRTTASIGKLRGRLHDYRGTPVLCTYHPAYLLRNPAAKKDVWEDMKFLMKQMGRPVE